MWPEFSVLQIEKTGLKELSKLAKVTQLASGRGRINPGVKAHCAMLPHKYE